VVLSGFEGLFDGSVTREDGPSRHVEVDVALPRQDAGYRLEESDWQFCRIIIYPTCVQMVSR
jgi:hypothetical protein